MPRAWWHVLGAANVSDTRHSCPIPKQEREKATACPARWRHPNDGSLGQGGTGSARRGQSEASTFQTSFSVQLAASKKGMASDPPLPTPEKKPEPRFPACSRSSAKITQHRRERLVPMAGALVLHVSAAERCFKCGCSHNNNTEI